MRLSKKTKTKVIFSFITIIFLLVAFKIFDSYINKPSQGVIYTPSGSQTSQSSINLTPKLINGKYATFNVPSCLTQVANSKIITPELSTYNFSYKDIEPWNLAIDILNIPTGKITDNNAYQVRQINPTMYAPSQININGQNITVMTDKSTGGFSKVAFLVNGQYQATISLYGDDIYGTKPLDSTFNMVLSSWHWQ